MSPVGSVLGASLTDELVLLVGMAGATVGMVTDNVGVFLVVAFIGVTVKVDDRAPEDPRATATETNDINIVTPITPAMLP